MTQLNTGIFSESLNLLKKTLLYFLLFDALFIVSIYSVHSLISSYIFDFRNMLTLIQQNNLLIFVMIPLLILYLLIMLAIYAFFKYIAFDALTSIEQKIKQKTEQSNLSLRKSLKHFISFYLLNVKVFSIFFVLFGVINIIFFSIPNRYIFVYAILTLYPFMLALNYSITIVHSLFALHGLTGIKKILLAVLQEKLNAYFIIAKFAIFTVLYFIYNYLGLNNSIFFWAFTFFATFITYFTLKLEICYYYYYYYYNNTLLRR